MMSLDWALVIVDVLCCVESGELSVCCLIENDDGEITFWIGFSKMGTDLNGWGDLI